MTYLPLDHKFPQHPKILPLSDAGFRLHVCGMNYCSEHLTDGLIPVGAIPTLVPHYRTRTLAELVAAGLWEKHAGMIAGYVVHDFLDWNRSREQVEKRRESAAIGARVRWAGRINGGGTK